MEIRKRKRPSSSQSSRQPSVYHLDDNLLVEILQRLPTSKDVLRCSSVCKHWYALFSKPYFITRFISHHVDRSTTDAFREYQSDNAVLVLHFGPETESPRFLPTLLSANSNSTSRDFGLGNMIGENLDEWGKILSSYNDLMFCLDKKGKVFHLVNPFTREKIVVPRLPRSFVSWNYFNAYTLVCEPYYSRNREREYSLNFGFRYRILGYRPSLMQREHRFVMYCSETKEWTEYAFKGEEYGFKRGNVVAYEGKLYWYTGKDIMVRDPFNDFAHLYSIKSPIIEANFDVFNIIVSCHLRIGFCGEVLRMIRQETDSATPTCSLTVWDLKDHEGSEWSKSNYCIDIDLEDPYLEVLNPHPVNKDIVYLHMWDQLIPYDMRRRERVNVAKCHRVKSRRQHSRSEICRMDISFLTNEGGPSLEESEECGTIQDGNVVAYEGKVYWYTGRDTMVHDPFNDFAPLYPSKDRK